MTNTKLRSILRKVVVILVTVLFAFSGFLIGLIISQFLQSNEFSFLSICMTVGFIAVSILIAGQTHRFGHFLAGKLLDYRLLAYDHREIIMIPAQREKTPAQQIWYYAAGILCNLILGILLLLVICLAPLGLSAAIWLFLFALSLTWIATACIQATSYYEEDVPTDGKVLWGLLFHSDFSRYYVANTNLSAAFEAGLRPSEIPMRSYREGQTLVSADYNLILQLYYKALDLKKASVMLKYGNLLEKNFSNLPDHLEDTVICELCYLNILKGQSQQARSYFALMREFSAESRTMAYYRVCAAYFFHVRHNPKAALSSISYAMESSPDCTYAGIRAMEQDLLKILLEEIIEAL